MEAAIGWLSLIGWLSFAPSLGNDARNFWMFFFLSMGVDCGGKKIPEEEKGEEEGEEEEEDDEDEE